MWKWLVDILSSRKLLIKLSIAVLVGMWAMTYSPADAYANNSCPSTMELKERYQSSCFPCQIVKVLVASFMKAAAKVYDVSREAGTKLLMLGTFIWVAFWALRKLSSLTNPEPMGMLNELFIFLGKVVVAYVFIVSGIGVLIGYAINPILSAGADMGNGLMLESSVVDINQAPAPENAYNGPTEIVSAEVMNKILKFSEGVSNEVATNMMIGNALTCYAIFEGINWDFIIHIHIPDIWLWLCGAAIWCAGFMLTLSVCYYLIDIPFKLGFAVISLPVVIGLWPFKMTSGKLKSCIEISLNAAGTFVFLALSSSYAMRLISQALTAGGGLETTDASGNAVTLTGKDALMKALEADKGQYIQQLFEITGPYFIIIMFCYIYGIKLISTVSSKYPSEWFGSGLTAGASPIHQMATGATNWLGQKAMAPVKMAGNIVANQAGKAATTVAKAGANLGVGAIGYAAGAVAKPIARKMSGMISAHGAAKAKKAQGDLESLQNRRTELDKNGNFFQKLGNNVKQSNARFRNNLGAKVEKFGQNMPEKAENLKGPLRQTFGRIQENLQGSTDALNGSWNELKGAASASVNDAAGYVPHKVGVGISNLGNQMTDKGITKLGKAVNNVGQMINANKPGMETDADARLSAAIEKREEGRINRGEQRKTIAQEGKNILSSIKGLTLGSAFKAVQNKIIVAGAVFAADVKEGWQHDLGKITLNAQSLAQSTKTFGDFKEKTQSNLSALGDSSAALGKATVDIPNKMKRDFAKSVQDTKASASDVASQVSVNIPFLDTKPLTPDIAGEKPSKARVFKKVLKNGLAIGALPITYPAKLIAKVNKGSLSNTVEGFVEAKEAYKRADVLTMAAAPVGGLIRTADGMIKNNIEYGYVTSEKLMLHAIDLGKTVLSPTKAIGEFGFHVANTAVDASRVALGGTIGSMATIGVNAANTVGSSINLVGRTALKTTGAVLAVGLSPITYSAKLVDKTFGAATTAASLYVTQPLSNNIEVATRWVAATAPAKSISKTLHTAKAGFKVGRDILRVGTGFIKAAAGESGKGHEKNPEKNKIPLTPEELKKQKAEKAQTRKEEREKREKERKLKEQRQNDEEMKRERQEQERERQEQERERREAEQKRAEALAEAQRLRDEEQNNNGSGV